MSAFWWHEIKTQYNVIMWCHDLWMCNLGKQPCKAPSVSSFRTNLKTSFYQFMVFDILLCLLIPMPIIYILFCFVCKVHCLLFLEMRYIRACLCMDVCKVHGIVAKMSAWCMQWCHLPSDLISILLSFREGTVTFVVHKDYSITLDLV